MTKAEKAQAARTAQYEKEQAWKQEAKRRLDNMMDNDPDMQAYLKKYGKQDGCRRA